MSGSRRSNGYWSRIISLLAAVVALCLLPGCSAIKLAYTNAPELAYWWIDGYADLEDAQSVQVREELRKLHQWHRTTELPRIAEMLRRVQPMALTDATPEQACALFAEARGRFDAVVDQAEGAAVALATSLNPAQLAHIETKFGKSNREWREEWAAGSLPERQARRLKKAVERAEQFYGGLEERQLAVLRSGIATSEFDAVTSYAERLRRQQDLLQTLRQMSGQGNNPSAGQPVGARPTPAQATAALRGYLARSVDSPNLANRAYSDRLVQENCRILAQLHNATTPEQRMRAQRRLAAYERDAREVSASR